MSKRRKLNNGRACSVETLDYDWVPDVQQAVESSQIWLTGLDFRCDKTDAYINLDETYVYAKLQVLKGDDSELTARDFATVINFFGYSMFSNCEIFISDQRVTTDQVMFPWICYLRYLLYKPKDAYVLKFFDWIKDPAEHLNEHYIPGGEGIERMILNSMI